MIIDETKFRLNAVAWFLRALHDSGPIRDGDAEWYADQLMAGKSASTDSQGCCPLCGENCETYRNAAPPNVNFAGGDAGDMPQETP